MKIDKNNLTNSKLNLSLSGNSCSIYKYFNLCSLEAYIFLNLK